MEGGGYHGEEVEGELAVLCVRFENRRHSQHERSRLPQWDEGG